jgi:hypothetical protein
MKHKDDNIKLDDVLRNHLAGPTAKFDFEAWKTKHPAAVETFTTRRPQRLAGIRMFRVIPQNRMARLALAACLILAAALILQVMSDGRRPSSPPVTAANPAAMISRLSLTLAYSQGGMDAVDAQYNKAYALLGPRAGTVSMNSLLERY